MKGRPPNSESTERNRVSRPPAPTYREGRKMMGTMRVTGAALVVATALIPGPVHAQRGGGFRGGGGPNMGKSLEVVLEKQEELGLNQDQITQFQELKGILNTDVAPVIDEMAGVRKMIQDGEIDRDEGLRQMEALRGLMITKAAPVQGRVQQILTVEQHRALQSAVRQGRPGAVTGAVTGAFRGGGGQIRGAMRGRGVGQAQSPRIGGRGGARGGNPGVRGLSSQRRIRQGAALGYRGINSGASPLARRGLARGYGRGSGSQSILGKRGIGGLPPDGF